MEEAVFLKNKCPQRLTVPRALSLMNTIELFTDSTKMADSIFLPMLYMWTDASILSYVEMLSCAKDLIPDICGQCLNNSGLHK